MTIDRTRRHALPELGGTVARLPRYVRLSQALLRDPRLSNRRKAALVAGIAYLVSPIDLVPGIVPVAGQLDDLFVVLYAIRTALRGLPPDDARRHVADAGLAPTALATDIEAVRGAARWTALTVARAGRTAVGWSVRLTGQAARTAGRVAGDARRQWRQRR